MHDSILSWQSHFATKKPPLPGAVELHVFDEITEHINKQQYTHRDYFRQANVPLNRCARHSYRPPLPGHVGSFRNHYVKDSGGL
jgi:hypothetical protein